MLIKRRKKASPGHHEHRVHERAPLMAEITVDSEHNFYLGFSENISEGGIFISTYQPAEIGTELDLSFTLPGQADPFKVRGRVRWVREYSPLNSDVPPGIGLQFIDAPEELLDAVQRFISGREPTFYDG